MNHQRYTAYRSLVSELDEWRSSKALEPDTHAELRDSAEALLLARRGDEAEEPLARASSAAVGLIAADALDERDAAWLLESMLACAPRVHAAQPLPDSA